MLVLKTGFYVSKHEKLKYKYENVSREGSCPHTGNGNIIQVLPVCGWECEGQPHSSGRVLPGARCAKCC